MITLAINTATSKLSVVLGVNGKIYSHIDNENNHAHSVKIMGAIDDVLAQANIKLKDIECLSSIIGPGSFTGIRIGVSVVNAFALSLGITPVAVTIFDTVPYNEQRRIVMFDARHDNYYVAKTFGNEIELLGTLTKAEIDNLDGEKLLIDESYAPNDNDFLSAVERRKHAPKYEFAPLYMRETEAERKCK